MGDAKANPASPQYTGPDVLLDARGRPLQEGDELILNLRGPVFFRIAQITPALDPKLPPGIKLVHVGTMITFTAQRGKINPEFIRVRTADEAGPQTFKVLSEPPGHGEAS